MDISFLASLFLEIISLEGYNLILISFLETYQLVVISFINKYWPLSIYLSRDRKLLLVEGHDFIDNYYWASLIFLRKKEWLLIEKRLERWFSRRVFVYWKEAAGKGKQVQSSSWQASLWKEITVNNGLPISSNFYREPLVNSQDLWLAEGRWFVDLNGC